MGNEELKSVAWKELGDIASYSAEEGFSRFYIELANAVFRLQEADKISVVGTVVDSVRAYLTALATYLENREEVLMARLAMEHLQRFARAAKDEAEEKRWILERVRSFQNEAERRKAPETATSGNFVAAVLYEQSYYILKDLLSRFDEEFIRTEMQLAKKKILFHLGSANYRVEKSSYPLPETLVEEMKRDTQVAIEKIMKLQTVAERFDSIIIQSYVPDLVTERKTAEEMLEGLIFWKISPMRGIESNRFVSSHNEENYIEHQVDLDILQSLNMHMYFFFCPLLEQMVSDSQTEATAEIATLFLAKNIVDRRCERLLKEGLQAWANRSYAVALHMLVPRFEDSFRRLLRAMGGETVVERNGIYQEATLDDMLQIAEKTGRISRGLLRLFRIVFTLQGGPNLRNRVCHGLASDSECDELSAYQVLYCFVQLLRWKLSPRTSA
jgi:hypothetical protein